MRGESEVHSRNAKNKTLNHSQLVRGQNKRSTLIELMKVMASAGQLAAFFARNQHHLCQ